MKIDKTQVLFTCSSCGSLHLANTEQSGEQVAFCWDTGSPVPLVNAKWFDENDWRTCDDPEVLLHYLKPRAAKSTFRLFAVECCASINLMQDPVASKALEAAKQHVQGQISDMQLSDVYKRSWGIETSSWSTQDSCNHYAAVSTANPDAWEAALHTSQECVKATEAFSRERQRQIAIIHSLFENPFSGMADESA